MLSGMAAPVERHLVAGLPPRCHRPRTRRLSPAGRDCTPPRRMSPSMSLAGACDARLDRDEWEAGVDRAQVFRVGGHHGVPLLLR